MTTPRTQKLNEQAEKRGFKSHNDYLKSVAKRHGFNSYNEYQLSKAKEKGFKSIHFARKGIVEEKMSLDTIRRKYGFVNETFSPGR